MAFNDLSKGMKITAVTFPVIGGIAGAIAWVFVMFETVDASDQKWASHNRAIACRTVYDLEKEVQRYIERLRFDQSITEADRIWIQQQISMLNEKIERIDPRGEC